jgi:exodeoxyribonuclease-1
VTLKLERLTAANGIAHGQAHDALADVRATIALARLVRERQPKLYDFLYQLRSKQRVHEQIQLLQPLVHVSGRFSAERGYLSVVLPLAWHPKNRNALIVCDLQADHLPLLELDGEALRQRLYRRRDQLAEGESPVPLKLVHVNKCPVLAPLKVLRDADRERLGVDLTGCLARAARIGEQQALWRDKLALVYAEEAFPAGEDPEQMLYDGFIGDRDRQLCERVRRADPAALARENWPFDDPRLPELLFRYRARNFAETLSLEEQQRWAQFCRSRLTVPEFGAPNILAGFDQALRELQASARPEQQPLLREWQEYAQGLRVRWGT